MGLGLKAEQMASGQKQKKKGVYFTWLNAIDVQPIQPYHVRFDTDIASLEHWLITVLGMDKK